MSTASDVRSRPTNRSLILAVLCIGQAMVFVDVSIVNVALPTIGGDLTIPENQLQYLVTGYGAALGGLLVLSGRLGDLMGHRRTLVIGVLLFVLASVAAGASITPSMLIAARVAQGAGAALMTPAGLAILNSVFPEGPERARAFGIWGALGGLGAIVGVILSGVLTDTLGWRSIFLINAPIGIAVLIGIRGAVPSTDMPQSRARLDVAGGVLIAAGLLGLCFGLGELTEGSERLAGLAVIAAGLFSLAVASLIERRTTNPIIPAGLFTRPGLTWVLVLTVLAFGTLLTLFFFTSLYLNQVLDLTPMLTGLAYLPVAASVVIGSTAGSQLVQRWGSATLLPVAFCLSAAGTASMAITAPAQTYAVSLLPGFVVAGLGIGSSFVALQIAVMDGVQDRESGLIGGIFGTSQEAGGALALAIATTVAFAGQAALSNATRAGFAIACGFALTALVISTARRPFTDR